MELMGTSGQFTSDNMTLKTKVGGEWKDISTLKVKIGGEWKDVSTLYSKKDGAWVTVYSSGALITFTNYPYPIPVAAGWKYSTDKMNWTTVSSDGTINDGGSFTGYVKVTSELTLSNYYSNHIAAQYGLRTIGNSMPSTTSEGSTFIINNHGFLCRRGGGSAVYILDLNGNWTSGTAMTYPRKDHASFSNGTYGYVCGGYGNASYLPSIDRYDGSGNKTMLGKYFSSGRKDMTAFFNAGKGYICGGSSESRSYLNYVDVLDASENLSSGSNMSVSRSSPISFVNSEKGYVCGGQISGSSSDAVDVYNSDGTRTTGTSLSQGRIRPASFVNAGLGYVCGGSHGSDMSYYSSSVVDVYNSSGVRSSGTSLSVPREYCSGFLNNQRGYVCGGYHDVSTSSTSRYCAETDMYDSNGTRSAATSLSIARMSPGTIVLGSKGYVCGGNAGSSGDKSRVDVYYDVPESYSTKLPITSGSTYTLNGTTTTATESQILSFDEKVSGTIKYIAGTIPSS